MKKSDYQTKIVVVGRSATGKTSLVKAINGQQFCQKSTQTIGVDLVKIRKTINSKKIELCFWDTAGQQRFRNVAKCFFNKADAIIYVFQLTDLSSLDALQYWVEQVRQSSTQHNILQFFIANKSDVKSLQNDQQKQTIYSTISSFFKQKSYKQNIKWVNQDQDADSSQYQSIQILQVSAKTKYNLKQFVNIIAHKLLHKKQTENPIGNRPICISQTQSKLTLRSSSDKKCC